MSNALSYIASNARQHDRDRFLCSLFAPKAVREGLFAILAFNIEISKTREMVRDELLGQIRLQWWRDAIELIYDNSSGEKINHLVVSELAVAIDKFKLSRTLFDHLIDARSRDLFDSPFKNETELSEYIYGTSATLSMLLMEILCQVYIELIYMILEKQHYLAGYLLAENSILNGKIIFGKMVLNRVSRFRLRSKNILGRVDVFTNTI